jgi:dephospho-CoA kinase
LNLYAGRPIIGVVGGIGSGKSFIADLFGEFGCMVIHSDKLVEDAYNHPDVRQKLDEWWGKLVFEPDGQVNRRAIGQRIFADDEARSQLEGLIHPIVDQRRRAMMNAAQTDDRVTGFVWDSPLLMETGLDGQCDALVFVDSPPTLRRLRVAGRGWDEAEMESREKLQLPLDKKREISEYVIDNTADADYARGQVKEVLTRIRG